jgi:hypothetical protein
VASSRQEDLILRMIRQMAQLLETAAERKDAGDLDGAMEHVGRAQAELLGPVAPIAPRLDAASAVRMVDARQVVPWAQMLAEQADVLRRQERPDAAIAAERRALELLLELAAREHARGTEIRDALRPLSTSPAVATLRPDHAQALADLLRPA